MTNKKSFFIILRIFFVLFSLILLKIVFYKWDGFSYYVTFIDFLNNLSLTFVLWTAVGVLFSFVLWLSIYLLSKVISLNLKHIRIEHLMFYLGAFFLLLFIKWGFFETFSFRDMILSHKLKSIAGGAIVILIITIIYKHVEKIVNAVNSRITPLFWLFFVLLILSIPFSGSLLLKQFTSKKILYTDTVTNDKRPNIILVIWDAMTARNMQIYGYDRSTTPFLSEWTSDAVKFTNVHSSSNWTCPTTMTLMTGQQPWTHKVWFQAIFNPLDTYQKSLPAILKDNGYSTYAFVQNNQAHPNVLGLYDYFLVKDKYHTFHSIKDGWNWHMQSIRFLVNEKTGNQMVADFISSHPIFMNLLSFLSSDSSKNTTPAEEVYNRFLRYISYNPKQPFFAWLHILPPHDPYLSPEPFKGFFGDSGKLSTFRQQSMFFHQGYNPQQQTDVDILRKRYDEFILYSDKQFEIFMSQLEEILELSNTIIIFTSDHGESFSHGFQGHTGPHLYEEFVHIPLIFKIQGKGENKIIDFPVSQIDIAPTILDFAGIQMPRWMEGRPLTPLLEGESLELRPVFSMQLDKNSAVGKHPITKGTIAVWSGDYKLIHYLEDKKSLLFNLRYDSEETQDLINEKPEIAEKLEELIRENLVHANKRITQFANN